MSASVTHVNHHGDRPELLQQGLRAAKFTLELVKRAVTPIGNALMRWAIAYESTAQERIMRELALSHPSLVADIRASRAAAAAEAARRSPVTGMWE